MRITAADARSEVSALLEDRRRERWARCPVFKRRRKHNRANFIGALVNYLKSAAEALAVLGTRQTALVHAPGTLLNQSL